MADICAFPLCKRVAEKNGFCIGHRSFAGVDLTDPKPVAMPAKSSKRKIDEKEYRKLGKAFLKKHPLCAAKFTGCTKQATQIHHKRGRVGGNYLNEKTWLPVCGNCHQKIELTPADSKEKGLSETRIK